MAKLPEKVGKYKILSLVGKGGMGIVYAAEHPTLKRKVILKKLTIRDKEFRERFRLEAQTMMDLRSDYIVDLYDHFREGSSYYIAMEFIDGITLDQLISKTGPLDFDLLVYIMNSISIALEYIHERGITHRDIKPSNIYISNKGEVKLGDFGIASSVSRDVKITDSGSAMGTPAYMAPEQFNDSSTVDHRADIFSLGVTLYEAVYALKPFRSEIYTELKQEICNGRYKRIPYSNKKVAFFLKVMIWRCLFLNRYFRPQNMQSIKKRFQRELKNIGLLKAKERLSSLIESGFEKKKTALTKIVKEPDKRKSSGKITYPILISLGVVLSLFIYWGGIYKVFLSGSYGKIVMSMVPASEEDRYSIYSYENQDFLQIKEGRFNNRGLASHYLKEGSYRIRIESGSKLSWRSFYISSFKDTNGEDIEMTLLSSPLDQLPLDLDLTVKDRFTQEDILKQSIIYLKRNSEWVKFSSVIDDELQTGTELELKIQAEGYKTNFYKIDVAHHQTSLQLNVLMTPVAAILKLNLHSGDLKINGRTEYFSLDTLRFEKLNRNNQETRKLMMLPGSYNFTFKKNDETVEVSAILESGMEFDLILK